MSADATRPAITVRLLSEADCDIFWPVRLRGLQEDPDAFGATYEESLALPRAEKESRLRQSEDRFVYGAFSGANLVGTAGFFRHQGMKVRHKGVIWGVYVTPEGRGLGTGKKLIEAVITQAKKLPHLEKLFLTVSNPPARRLYEGFGFQGQGVETGSLKDGERYIDEETMYLSIK